MVRFDALRLDQILKSIMWRIVSSAPRLYALVADGRRIVHSTFPDGSEMIEEYDVEDDCLLIRKTRKNSPFGKRSSWEYEIGAPPTLNPGSCGSGAVGGNDEEHQRLLTPTAASPFCVMLDTKRAFQWRIRNLPYPISTYSVDIDEASQEIVVRTTNKKYFKRLAVRPLKNVGLSLDARSLSWTHQHNTLVLTYLKPGKVIEYENARIKEAKKCSALLSS
ncbi:UNVERIFIED_CONTAM: hypothetical protein H355_011232 [Colinus virginianus]|nr:hypothetical protein H355_011232 [Colinus virginianus]